MKDFELKISWNERAKIINDPEEIKKYYKAYHYGCAEAAVDFINRFCFTMDPRKLTDRVLPFELFKKQEEYITWLWDRYIQREDGVVDKCRGVGMSWMNSAFSVYLLIFQTSVTVSMFSYKAEEVHTLKDIDTLVEKCIFIIDKLPALFKSGIEDKHMRINNNKNGSIIAGKSGLDAGRCGRSSIFFLDECSKYPNAESIEAAVSQNSLCKIWGSTHHGTNTLFYRKTTSGANPVFVIDWWEIPLYDQEWYDKEKEKAEAEGTMHVFQQEVERNAGASVENVVVPFEWVSNSLRNKVKITGRRIAGLDPADEGGDTHGFVIIDGNYIEYATESGEGDPGDATDKYFWMAVDKECDEFRYEPNGIGVGVAQRLKEILIKAKSEISKLKFEIYVSKNQKEKDSKKEEMVRYQKALDIAIVAWNPGGAVMRPEEQDFAGKKNKDMFENAKAQAWWKVRAEFLQTFRSINGKDHDEGSLISFPDEMTLKLNKLTQEISQPQYKPSKSGKTMIDKKPKGTKSPNIGDAYMFCRAEVKIAWKSWSVV